MLCKDTTFRSRFQTEFNEKSRRNLDPAGLFTVFMRILTAGCTRLVILQCFRHPLLNIRNTLLIRRVIAQEDRWL